MFLPEAIARQHNLSEAIAEPYKGGINMKQLYEMAIDPTLPLNSRYAAVKLMLTKRKYRAKQIEKNARQRKYNSMRKDWRVYA